MFNREIWICALFSSNSLRCERQCRDRVKSGGIGMREFLLGVFLGGCAWTDGKKKEINLLWLLFWAAVGTFYIFVGMWSGGFWDVGTESIKRLGGIFVGLFLLAAAVISGGQVGAGDGLVFLVCGLYLDFWESNLLLMSGLLLLVGKYVLSILQGHKNRSREHPLFPYVFAAYMGGLLWKL